MNITFIILVSRTGDPLSEQFWMVFSFLLGGFYLILSVDGSTSAKNKMM